MKGSKYIAGLCMGLWLIAFILVAREASAQTANEYREKGVTVALAEQWYPYSFVDKRGNNDGFLVDYWQAWSQKTGIPVQFKMAVWKDAIEQVANGESDIHCGLFFTETRDEILDYIKPIVALKGVFVVNKDYGLDCDAVLESRAVGVSSKGYAESYVQKNYPQVELKRYITTNLLFDALLADIVQGLAIDYGTYVYERERRGVGARLEFCQDIYEKDLQAAVREGNTPLLRVVEAGMFEISADERERIQSKWFVEEDSSLNIWVVVLASLIMVFLVGLVMFFWVTRR